MTEPWKTTGDRTNKAKTLHSYHAIPCDTIPSYFNNSNFFSSTCPTAAATTIVRSSRIEFGRKEKVVGTEPTDKVHQCKEKRAPNVPMSCPALVHCTMTTDGLTCLVPPPPCCCLDPSLILTNITYLFLLN